jgi:hypothetical protein
MKGEGNPEKGSAPKIMGRKMREENELCQRNCRDRWEEFRLYHRRDGRVVKEGDDLMAATRYALMMLRWSRTETERKNFNREIVYPDLGII